MIRHAPPLILLPAMGCDGQLWARQVIDLSDVTHPMLGDLTVDDALEAMAARVLAHAPPRFAVAGVSLGGYVALEVIRQAPERVQRGRCSAPARRCGCARAPSPSRACSPPHPTPTRR